MDEVPTATRWAVYEPADMWVPRINVELAKELNDLYDSLVFTQMAFLIRISNHIHDGRYWAYKTADELWQESFPFFSRPTIAKALQRLCDTHHLLDRRNDLNQRKGDRTYWYAINVEYASRLRSIVLVPVDKPTIVPQEQALPDITTESLKDSLPRQKNAWYDAIESIWHYSGSMNGSMQKLLCGTATRAGWKEYNLETPLTDPDQLLRWAVWYRAVKLGGNPDLNMVEERAKIQSSIAYWQSLDAPDADAGEVPQDSFEGMMKFLGVF